jgi:hypothetical protein
MRRKVLPRPARLQIARSSEYGRAMRRPSVSDVLASTALFVALGGTSYAALKLPKNSVGEKQIRANAIRSEEVKDRSLREKDFKKGELPRGATGPAGAAGPTGAAGSPGVVGAAFDTRASDFSLSPTNSILDTDPLEATITTTQRARLVANAAIRLKDIDAGNDGEARCKLTLDPPPPDLTTGTPIGQEMQVPIPTNTHGNLAAAGWTAALPAGTYYVALHCLSVDDGATFVSGDLTVLALREP